MAIPLSQLVAEPTKEEILAMLLKQVQGIGFTYHSGYGSGNVTLTGSPLGNYKFVIEIMSSGSIGVGTFRYATDGLTFGATATIPASLDLTLTLGVSILFTALPNPSGEAPFLVGDKYTIDAFVPVFQSTAWATGSTGRTLIENDAEVVSDLRLTTSALAKSAFVASASGPWLDLKAEDYKLKRLGSVAASGVVSFTCAVGSGPYTITPNQLWVASTGGQRFNTVDAFVIPAGGSISAAVHAEQPGLAYNVANNTITKMVTQLAGVTVLNPPDPETGTWLDRQGVDEESDDSLRNRCMARWPGLGGWPTESVVKTWVREASATATRILVRASQSVAGLLEVYAAGPAGPLSGGVMTTINNYLQLRKPLTTTIALASPTSLSVSVFGSVYVASQFQLATQTIANNLTALFNGGRNSIGETLPGIQIGGVVYRSQIIEQIQIVEGVRNVELTLPASNLQLGATQVATLNNILSTVAV